MKKQPYTPDWANIPEQYNWVGVTRCGNVTAYIHKPCIDVKGGVWRLSADGYDWKMDGDKMTLSISSLIFCPAIDPPGKKWRTMLYERPKENNEAETGIRFEVNWVQHT